MALVMAGHTISFEQWLDVFHEINPLHFFQLHCGWPDRALFNPGPEQGSLRAGERITLGRHDILMARRQNDALVKRTIAGLPRHQRRPLLAALERPGSGMQTKMAFGL